MSESKTASKRPELRKIVTHRNPHLDELAAVAAILEFGHMRRWYWKKGTEPEVEYAHNENAALAAYKDRTDVVFVGIGGGEFDEHRAEGRLPDTSAFKLVLQALEMAERADLEHFLKEVVRSDVEATQENLSLAQVLKVAQRYGPVKDEIAPHLLYLVRVALVAYQERGHEFHKICPADFDRTGYIVELDDLRMAVVTSDVSSMGAWARTRKDAHIVVQAYSTGHVRVFGTNHDRHPLLADVIERAARHLMAHEMRAMGQPEAAIAKAWEQFPTVCERSNDLPGYVPWYYLRATNSALLNGSHSHEREPTRLELEGVADTIREAYEAVAKERKPVAQAASPATEAAPAA